MPSNDLSTRFRTQFFGSEPLPTLGASDVWQAAWERENLIGSFNANYEASSHPPVDDYSPFQDTSLSPYQQLTSAMLEAESPQEASDIHAQITREQINAQIISDAGWGGILASIGAGVISPENLIPVGGLVSRGGKLAKLSIRAVDLALAKGVARQTGSRLDDVLRSSFRTSVEATAGAALSEVGLQATQQERTLRESAYGVVGASVLGGLLGAGTTAVTQRLANRASRMYGDSVGAHMDKVHDSFEVVQKRLGRSEDFLALSPEARQVKFQEVMSSVEPTSFKFSKDGFFRSKMLSFAEHLKFSPGMRGVMSEHSPSERAIFDRYFELPFLKDSGASLPTVEAAVNQASRRAAAYYGEIFGIFTEYRANSGGREAAKFSDFSQRVGAAVSSEGRATATEKTLAEAVGRAAEKTSRFLESEFTEPSIRAGLLSRSDVKDSGYYHRVYDLEKINSNPGEFIERISTYIARSRPDVTPFTANHWARQVLDNIRGEGMAEINYTLLPKEAGSLRQRTLRISDGEIGEFLIRDADKVVHRLSRSLSPDIALAQARPLGDGWVSTLSREVETLRERVDKELSEAPVLREQTRDDVLSESQILKADLSSRVAAMKAAKANLASVVPDSLKGKSAADLKANSLSLAAKLRNRHEKFLRDSQAGTTARKRANWEKFQAETGMQVRKLEALSVYRGRFEGLETEVAMLNARVTKARERLKSFKAESKGATQRKVFASKSKTNLEQLALSETMHDMEAARALDNVFTEQHSARAVRLREISESRSNAIIRGDKKAADNLLEQVMVFRREASELKKSYSTASPALASDPKVAMRQLEDRSGGFLLEDANDGLSLVHMRKQISREYDEAVSAGGGSRVARKRNRALKDLERLVLLMRNKQAFTRDPTYWGFRAERAVRALQTMRYMGGMTISSLPDVAMLTFVNGFRRPLALIQHLVKSVMDTVRGATPETRGLTNNEEAVRLVAMFEAYGDNARMQNIADIMDLGDATTKSEKGITWLTDKFISATGIRWWNTTMKAFAAMDGSSRIIEDSIALTRGSASPAQVKGLALDGVDEALAKAISEQFSKHGKVDGGLHFANSNSWDNDFAAALYQEATGTRVNRTIVTPSLAEIPILGRKPLFRMLLQFRAFSISSTQKVAISGLQRGDAAVYQGMLGMVTMGAVVYGLKEAIAGRDPFEKSDEDWLVNAIDRSGVLGIAADLDSFMTRASGGRLGLSPMVGASGPSRWQQRSSVDVALGPSAGLADEVSKLIGAINSEEWSGRDTHAMRRMLPFNNLFYMQWLLNRVEGGLNSSMGFQ